MVQPKEKASSSKLFSSSRAAYNAFSSSFNATNNCFCMVFAFCSSCDHSNQSTKSWAEVINRAFSCFIKFKQPALLLSWLRPGKAKTSRPYCRACWAVTKLPPRTPDSITIVACDKPAMMRLRFKKFCRSKGMSDQNSLINAPPWRNSFTVFACSLGYNSPKAWPKTATVSKPHCKAVLCASMSMPRAKPLTIKGLKGASSSINFRHKASPLLVGARVPTMLKLRGFFQSTSPSWKKAAGGSTVNESGKGKVLSP